MAFDHDGFFAIVGKYVKLIDQVDAYIDAIESRKGEIQTIYGTEAILDTYITVPPLINGMQQNITSWISALISDLDNLLLNRPYVIEQLGVSSIDRISILNAIYNYMVDEGETIESSVVSLGGSDTNQNASVNYNPTGDPDADTSNLGPRLYVSRILDGVSNPGNGVQAHIRYAGIESQLARTCNLHADIVSNTSGAEVALLFSDAQETPGYVLEDEEPGVGPSVTSARGINLVSSNSRFNAYAITDAPDGWAISGGSAGTAYEDFSSTGLGPLQINTLNVLGIQKLNGLQKNKMYFVAINFEGYGLSMSEGDTATAGVKIRDFGDSISYMTQQTATWANGTNVAQQAYGFFYLEDDANLEDVYVQFKYTARSSADVTAIILKELVVCEATYFNGLANVFWAPYQIESFLGTSYSWTPLGARTTIAIANNDNGVFQRFCRKGWFIQFPTADSPTINDSLAT